MPHRSRLPALLVVLVTLSCDAAAHTGSRGSEPTASTTARKTTVRFSSGRLELHGVVYTPHGSGPFPAILWNHGSWHDPMEAFDQLGPLFAQAGWVFFGPFRRGQGLSADAGPYIGDELDRAEGGKRGRGKKAAALLAGAHLDDQLAAYAWFRKQPYVALDQIAVGGNSLGGIETVLGAQRIPYCAAIDAAGASQIWAAAPELRQVMIHAARASRSPMLFLQAENDHDLTPTRVLSEAMRNSGKIAEAKIYPPFGNDPAQGHGFAWRGGRVWGADVLAFLERHCRNDHPARP